MGLNKSNGMLLNNIKWIFRIGGIILTILLTILVQNYLYTYIPPVPAIKIIDPTDGGNFSNETEVTGNWSGFLGDWMIYSITSPRIWLVLLPRLNPDKKLWPEYRILPSDLFDGKWNETITIGKGNEFDIAVWVVNPMDSDYFDYYKRIGKDCDCYPGIPQPENKKILDQHRVKRINTIH